MGLGNNNGQSVGQAGVWNAPNTQIYQWALADISASGTGTGFAGYNGYSSATAIAGTTGALQANVFGVSSIANDANNALSAAPALTTMSANIPNNTGNATITVASTAGLQVGQLVVGTNIAANAVIESITNGTTFVVTGTTGNVGFTNNQQITVYANPATAITGQTTAASTTVTLTGGATTANLYAGEFVIGVGAGTQVAATGIPLGDTIASITDATHFVLTTTAAVGASQTLVFGLPGYANISSANATNAFGNASAAQLINSLTLNNASSVSTITTGLQLDSGAVLALQSATIQTSGVGGSNPYVFLTGTNTLNREMIFHTVGASTVLTVNAPIFASAAGTAPQGGLTKADAGTLVLGTSELYLGDTTVNGGTLKLAGGQNTIFRPFTTAPTAGNSTAGVSGQNLTIDFGGALDLNGTTQSVANLRSGSGIQLAGGTIINSNGSAATLDVNLSANQTWAGNISNGQSIGTTTGNTIGLTGSASGGALNFVRDGGSFTLTVNSPNTLGGAVTFLGGATRLIDLGTFQNASAINVTRSAVIWDDTGVQAVSNRLSTSPITLTGGGFQFLSRAGTGSNPLDAISLGTLNLGIGASSIDPTTVNQGGVSQITFAGIGTRALGSTLTFNAGNGAGFVLGDNPRVFFTSAPTLTNGLIGAWATTSGVTATSNTNGGQAAFATYDPATGIRQLQYTALSTFGSGVNTLINASITIQAPVNTATTTTVNSVTLDGGSTQTVSFTNSNDTLLVQSGGIIEGNGSQAFGTTAVPGQITAGSVSNGGATTNNDLYLNILANTVTVNSKIIDNGSGSMNVIASQMAASANTSTLTLTNANTYGGTTYLTGISANLNSLLGPAIPHDVILSGSNVLGTDSLAFNQTSLNWQLSNQLSSTANITMNGATQLNLGSGTLSTGPNAFTLSNTQTINNLTFNNDGGGNGTNGPTVFTGAGALTINGTINATSQAETTTVPTINGFIVLGNASPTINVDIPIYSPANVGLDINANIALATATSFTKTGLGYIGFGGQTQNLVGTTFNLSAGGLAYTPGTGSALDVLGSAVVMSANTTIDTRGDNQGAGYGGLVVGSVASSSTSAVIMNGVQGTAGNLTTGLDNSSTTYAGTFFSPYPTGLLNVTKIGSGIWSLTNNGQATASGTLNVSNGTVNLGTVAGGGAISFQTYTLPTGGNLVLDNGVIATNNRLGGAFFTTSNTLAPTVRTLNMQGGNLTVKGNASTAVTEYLGALNVTGGGIITLNAAGTGGVNLTIESISGLGAGTSLLIRGDGLGNSAGVNTATALFATAGAVGTFPGANVIGGGGANGTLTRSIRPDILVDPSVTGLGASFLTVDSTTGLVRALNSSTELTGTQLTATAANTNLSLAAITYGSATANTLAAGNFAASPTNSVGSLTLQSGGGMNFAIVQTNPFGANGALLTFTDTVTGGVLNLAGSNTITAGSFGYGNLNSDVHVLTGSTLTVNALFTGSGGGLTKADGGTLILNGPVTSSNAQTITINGGTMQLGVGSGSNASILGGTTYNSNPLYVYINQGGVPSAENLAVNNGTLDLNGNNQLVGTLTSTNQMPFGGGTSASPNIIITNTNATTTSTFSTNGAALGVLRRVPGQPEPRQVGCRNDDPEQPADLHRHDHHPRR